MKNREKRERLSIAVLGQKVVPSRRGGIENVLTTLCPIFAEKGHDVTCYNRSGDKIENEYIDTVENNYYKGVRIKTVWTIKKRGVAAVTASFSGALAAAIGRYDIIHFHAEGPCIALWIPKLFGKRCIATVHGLDWQREKWKHGLGSKCIKLGERILAKYADEVIVLSKGIQQYFKDTYGRDTVLIPNGVSCPEIKEAKEIYEKYGLEKDTYFLGLSRLTEEKGVHYLIEAYQKIQTDKKLVIAGDTSDTDEYVAHLKKMAEDNPNIIFTGFVSGNMLDELYSNAYMYVLPSNLEGMPLTILEAMSYGNAVIGSDIPEIADVVEDKAVLFSKGNVKELAEKLQIAVDNPKEVKKMKEQAANFVCEKYNWVDVAEATLKVYRRNIK